MTDGGTWMGGGGRGIPGKRRSEHELMRELRAVRVWRYRIHGGKVDCRLFDDREIPPGWFESERDALSAEALKDADRE